MKSPFLGTSKHFLHKIHKDKAIGGGGRITRPRMLLSEPIHFCFPAVGNIWVCQFYILKFKFYIPICIAPTEELGLM